MIEFRGIVMSRRQDAGFSLVEIAIVLTVIGLVIGGLWLATGKILETKRTNDFANDFISMMANAQGFFNRYGSLDQFQHRKQFAYSHKGRFGLALDNSNSFITRVKAATAFCAGPNGCPPGPADGMTTTIAINVGIVMPDNIAKVGSTEVAVHPFATDKSKDSIIITGASRIITFTAGSTNVVGIGLPRYACVKIASLFGDQAFIRQMKIIDISINGASINNPGNQQGVITTTAATAACNSNSALNEISVSIGV